MVALKLAIILLVIVLGAFYVNTGKLDARFCRTVSAA